jgi:hypothetical protein
MGIIKRKLLFSAQNGQWTPMLALLLRGDEPTRTGIVVGKRVYWKASKSAIAWTGFAQ